MTPSILTRSGLMVPLDQPAPHHIRLGDIAHALARIPRFNGHTTAQWSVADHSLLVLELLPAGLPADIMLAALLHDAHEAYLGDITSPVAAAIRAGRDACPIDGLKAIFDSAIARAFALPDGAFLHPAIAEADRLALAVEVDQLMTSAATPWPNLAKRPDPPPFMPHRPGHKARDDFAHTALGLIAQRHGIPHMLANNHAERLAEGDHPL
jgi:uncharacterized protein